MFFRYPITYRNSVLVIVIRIGCLNEQNPSEILAGFCFSVELGGST